MVFGRPAASRGIAGNGMMRQWSCLINQLIKVTVGLTKSHASISPQPATRYCDCSRLPFPISPQHRNKLNWQKWKCEIRSGKNKFSTSNCCMHLIWWSEPTRADSMARPNPVYMGYSIPVSSTRPFSPSDREPVSWGLVCTSEALFYGTTYTFWQIFS